MKIHLAHENIDAELELIPTHRPQKQYHVSPEGERATYQRYIKFDVDLRDEILLEKENLASHLKESDIDIDTELAGKKVKKTNRITVGEHYDPVYNYTMFDVLHLADGSIKERPHLRTIGNINTELPVKITDELVDTHMLMLTYVFRKSYYIVHNNGVTYKFLYELAERLQKENKFARIDTFNPETKKREPLVLYDGGRKFPRAFLEGRVKDDKYALILHLSDQELKLPESLIPDVGEEED
ncbi:MAG: hypothetical protein ACFFB5_24535 [Promethearchaeota archaeon]